jgi:hypothetical protein
VKVKEIVGVGGGLSPYTHPTTFTLISQQESMEVK